MDRTRISGVYLKPLVGERLRTDPESTLRQLKTELNRRLKYRLLKIPTFSEKARRSLARSIRIHIKSSSLVISTNHPGFKPLLWGQKKQQMRWLTKSKVPIPIVLDSGKTIFRWATPQSMANGSWWHPGHERTTYVERAKREAREFIRKRLVKDLMLQLRSTIKDRRF